MKYKKKTGERPPKHQSMSINAERSGITTIPQPILNAMFEKAGNILSSPGNIIVKPGATDGSFVVTGKEWFLDLRP